MVHDPFLDFDRERVEGSGGLDGRREGGDPEGETDGWIAMTFYA